ncbi:A disintegrin and metalloproteinase with thrombospondin motifs 20-like isoform X1 [Tachypleus tridentatus]|uniref:A disintegrin and metalloproteinase with thrombospondin motifs 20-like isoform X1 n=2 Tax=Tachypleus tridentatus TaxID=6853 RepID=UPI003FD4E487
MWWVLTSVLLAGVTVKKAYFLNTDSQVSSLPTKSQLVHPVRLDASGRPFPGGQHYRRWSLEDWKQKVFYRWVAYNKTFLLQLQKDDNFIAPQFHHHTVELLDENTTLWIRPFPERCYYNGYVEGDNRSRVSLSLCKGMFGLIHTSHGDYTIEPVSSSSESTNFDDISQKTHRMIQLSLTHSSGKSRKSPMERCHLKDSAKSKRKNKMKTENLNIGDNFRRDFNNSFRMRSKRSVSFERNVEVLVVVDRQMADQYGGELRHYVLTLMSTVATIYKEPSLGNFVNIAVVKLVTLTEEEDREIVHSSASKTLRSFCRWQRINNHDDDSHPHHHDTAVLITRKDLCRVSKACDTLGLANPGMVCSRYSSCAIVEDNGLSAAFTIAHELGHVLGIPHDDDFKCRRHNNHGQTLKVMARMLDEKSYPWDWSHCSKRYITNFLDSGNGECLIDKPTENLLIHNSSIMKTYPGQIYDMDYQCELVFGSDSKICPYMPVCGKLWCTLQGSNNYGCRTQHMPWADGTFCSPNKWCQRGECVKVNSGKQEPVDGQWGKWQRYGQCTRDCGGGIQKSVRECDSPRPVHGGKYCLGQRTRYRSCNTHSCPLGTPDPRAEECSTFDGKTMNFHGLPSNVKWLPFYSENRSEACKLYCRIRGTTAHFLLKDRVIDGTPCDQDTFHICVNGVCENAGCDRILGSNKTLDRCGICGGDNSTCKTIRGHFNEVKYGYHSVVMIPAGANNIEILQYAYQNSPQDDNYLALVSNSYEYLLNGNFTVSPFKKIIKYAGTVLEYSGSLAIIERINTSKPLIRELHVQVLTVGNLRPPNIHFEYTVSLRDENKYRWELEEKWSECSLLCKGEMFQKPICKRIFDGQVVNENHCDISNKPSHVKPCNEQCLLSWKTSVTSECSSQCGRGTRQRDVKCVQEFSKHKILQVNNEFCAHLVDKPSSTESCEGNCFESHWMFGKWSACSKSCGGGEQIRSATCVDLNGKQLSESLCGLAKNLKRQSCNTGPCPKWMTEEWTECSVSCGAGERRRLYWCEHGGKAISGIYCNSKTIPKHTNICIQPACTKWDHGEWSPCSVTCGDGVSTRTVRCRTLKGDIVQTHLCDTKTQPLNSTACNSSRCIQVTIASATTETVKNLTFHFRKQNKTSLFEQSSFTPSSPASVPRQSVWRSSSWSECSTSCGEGMRTRHITCQDGYSNVLLSESSCNMSDRPIALKICYTKPCGLWKTLEWRPCSATCGQSVMTRTIGCFSLNGTQLEDQDCDHEARPVSEKICNLPACTKLIGILSETGNITHNKVEGFFWRTGPWGACSRTCGGGTQRRQVACYDELGRMSDQCELTIKPTEISQCEVNQCPVWSAGEWQQCNKPCGGGFQTRAVTCRDEIGQVIPEYMCDVYARPSESRKCNTKQCPFSYSGYRWYLSSWSPCSVSCGQGVVTRVIRCIDGLGRSVSLENCNGPFPKSFKQCIKPVCMAWEWSEWTKCSARCGYGVRIRHSICKEGNSTVDSTKCKGEKPGKQSQHCFRRLCNYEWSVSQWSQCSVSCGKGIQRREIMCLNESKDVVSKDNCETPPPADVRKCNQPECVQRDWTDWSQCSFTCGQGIQIRYPRCLQSNITVNDSECGKNIPEPATRSCSVKPCLFKWKKGNWSKCSATCGKGQKQREISCLDSNGDVVTDMLCKSRRKPKTTRVCKRVTACPYSWISDEWTQCSSSCGPGVQMRRAHCFKVNAYGWIDPNPLEEPIYDNETWCDRKKRPQGVRICNLGNCENGAVWKPWPWKSCSRSCGVGKQRRRVFCYNLERKRIGKRNCDRSLRPKTKRKCTMRPCKAVSCKDVQERTGIREDGEKELYIRGKILKIYCANMNTSNPQEYVSLPSGDSNNYSEMYDKRLLSPGTCPYNGTRHDSCPCVIERRLRSGLTTFSRLAINITTLQALTDDFTFSKTSKGQRVRYGEAGDCYSLNSCPQGRFSINLEDTGFILSEATQWKKYGTKPYARLYMLQNREVVHGKCGGYCGKCAPDVGSGLLLDVAPP